MANKARKYCKAYPCNKIATKGAYCQKHAPAAAAKETDPFYLSPAWRRFRNWYLGRHPICEICERDYQRLSPAVMVDHIREIKDGGARLSEDNAQALCWNCHNKKTAAERSKRKNHQKSNTNNRTGSHGDTY